MVNITDLKAKDCLGLKQLKEESNGDSIEMTEYEFREFLKPYLIDILKNDSTLCNQLSLACANESEEDTEDLNDLEELKRL